MAHELGSISDLQAGEMAMTLNNITLGFDATTQDGVHVNCIHLTSREKCIVIALDHLPRGTAHDYESHIYSCDFLECRDSIINNIKNTMSDRAPVNHSTIQKVCETWGKNLNKINCNLHPLETIATSCRSVLKSSEKESSSLFGCDCMAGNIVLAMNKLRYKDGKGDPKGFVKIFRQL